MWGEMIHLLLGQAKRTCCWRRKLPSLLLPEELSIPSGKGKMCSGSSIDEDRRDCDGNVSKIKIIASGIVH